MTRRQFLWCAVGAAGSNIVPMTGILRRINVRKPNVIIIMTDDQGYADVGCYGAEGFQTPHLDQMAREGARFTGYYAPHASCSPSRAALLTGCYAYRVSIPEVLNPHSAIGLNPSETTLAKLLKAEGYATGMVGKWHLGQKAPCLPTYHGFDEFLGLPYSNDMWPNHPDPAYRAQCPPLPLIDGEETVREMNTLEDLSELTTLYTERAVQFIRKNQAQPFFLYFAHSMPHVPLAVSDKFKGKSQQGLYGDVIMEIDWSVGQVLQTIRDLKLERDTLVVFTSDNGPWLSYGNHAGSTGGLREGKATTFEGGQRVPCIVWQPGTVPAGQTVTEPAMGIDWLPTVAEHVGVSLPEKKIDGLSILPLITQSAAQPSPHKALFQHYSASGRIETVRSGKWKLHLPHSYPSLKTPGKDGKPGTYETKNIGLELFNLETDRNETTNVASAHPDVVDRLLAMAVAHTEEIHNNARPPFKIGDP